jgi:hypothetical protein
VSSYLYAFPLWKADLAASNWLLLFFGIALSGIVLAALVVQYADLLYRVTGVETPYAKIQFATSATDRQLNPNIDRDQNNVDRFEDLPRSLRFIQYDCGKAAFDAGGMAQYKQKQEYKLYTNGFALRDKLILYVNRIVNAQRKGGNIEILKGQVKQTAEKFERLVSDPVEAHFHQNYEAAWAEVRRQEDVFDAERVSSKLPREEEERRLREPDPDYCKGTDAEVNEDNTKRLVEEIRLVHSFVASLFHFTDNIEGAIGMLTSAYRTRLGSGDINAIGGLADALYAGGRDLREVLSLEERDLEIVEKNVGQMKRSGMRSQSKDDVKIYADLVKRYDRARFIVRLRLAYLYAQHGLGWQEDIVPQPDLRWWSAQTYADDAYEKLLDKSKRPPRFRCTDDAQDLAIKDTYAFVKLAFQAYNLKTQRITPDQSQVKEARGVLEDALAEAREKHSLLLAAEPAMRNGGAAPWCLVAEQTKGWVKRILTHLKLADTLMSR